MWFSQDLIGETEFFLKKWQLSGNQQFVSGMVKFIDKQIKRSLKDSQSRSRYSETSKSRIQRKQNQSMCMHSVVQSRSLGRSQPLSNSSYIKTNQLKGSRRQSLKPESVKYTDSSTYDRLEKSLMGVQYNHSKRAFLEVFEQFRCALLHILDETRPKKKKILKLMEWFCESGLQILSQDHQFKHRTIKISE